MKKFKVYKDDYDDINKNALLPQHPYRALICGASGCGKSNWLNNILLHKESPFDVIIFYYKNDQSKNDVLQDKFDNLKRLKDKSLVMVKGAPDERLEGILEKYKDKPKCVVLDDLQSETKNSRLVSDLFTRCSHHLNTSVIVLHQAIFRDRILRLNADYMILFSFPMDKSSARTFFQFLEPLKWREILKTYEKCVSQPHGWMMIDAKSEMKGRSHLKYRCNALDNVYIPSSTEVVEPVSVEDFE